MEAEETKAMGTEEAEKILEASKKARLEAATQEFNTFLKAWSEKHKARLRVYQNIIDGQPHPVNIMVDIA